MTGQARARLDDGSDVRAEHVVLATGSPILDRGLYFAKLEPQRSYALAFEGVDAPEGMYLSAGSDSRSVRDAPGDNGGTRLLVGGAGHSVGRTWSEQLTSTGCARGPLSTSRARSRPTSGPHRTTARTTPCRTSAACPAASAGSTSRPVSTSGG